MRSHNSRTALLPPTRLVTKCTLSLTASCPWAGQTVKPALRIILRSGQSSPMTAQSEWVKERDFKIFSSAIALSSTPMWTCLMPNSSQRANTILELRPVMIAVGMLHCSSNLMPRPSWISKAFKDSLPSAPMNTCPLVNTPSTSRTKSLTLPARSHACGYWLRGFVLWVLKALGMK